MNKSYRTYTVIIWFFVAYAVWVTLNQIYLFDISTAIANHVAMPWGGNMRQFAVIFNALQSFVYAASCLMFALLAWTARGDYLSRTSGSWQKTDGAPANTEAAHG